MQQCPMDFGKNRDLQTLVVEVVDQSAVVHQVAERQSKCSKFVRRFNFLILSK